jgi:DNA repair protein RadC
MQPQHTQQHPSQAGDQPAIRFLGDDHPLHKFLTRGAAALSDGELLALVLDDQADDDTIRLGRQLVMRSGGLHIVARYGVYQLTQYDGMNEARAVRLLAAFELARRKELAQHRDIDISSPESVAAYIRPRLVDLDHEVFFVLYLNRQNSLVHERVLSVGGVSNTVIDPKLIFREALGCLASAIIVCHNHPSGNLQPSDDDRAITQKLKHGGKLLDIQLLDHIIVSHKGFYSFADEGVL